MSPDKTQADVEEVVWDAAFIERMLRGDRGIHIYFEDTDLFGVALFKDGKFRYETSALGAPDRLIFETDSFLEFAVWCAFYGRDFL